MEYMMPDDFSDIGSVKALLSDARERIKESEERSKDAITRAEDRLNDRLDEQERMMGTLNLDLNKWTPLLTNLQKADENKKNLTILLVASFITNLATIIIGIFMWFAKSGLIE
jgi:hypothetical protein